jgi:leucyl-tRNA synthetase
VMDTANLSDAQKDLRRKTHETITKVSNDVSRRMTFNTAIAAIMELLNEVNRYNTESIQDQAIIREALESAVLMLAPIVPHISQSLWQGLGHKQPVMLAAWPTVDEAALVKDNLNWVIQVNGKVRTQLALPAGTEDDSVKRFALEDATVQRFMEGKSLLKIILVPGKLVNIVVR